MSGIKAEAARTGKPYFMELFHPFNRNLHSGNPLPLFHFYNSTILGKYVNMNVTVFLFFFIRINFFSFSCRPLIATVNKKRVINFKLINSENFHWVE